MTIRQMTTAMFRQLAAQYPGTEIESFARILFRHYLNMTAAQLHLMQDSELSSEAEHQIVTAISELQKNRPIQYILGETEFYGLPFDLTPDVLIPRPETEELTDWIVRKYPRDARLTIVDIGTGSGCIAVALASNFHNADVWAVDISEAALAVAEKNTLKNRVKVHFLLEDVLNSGLMGFKPASLDVIVSNPPYVTPSEKGQILPNVLDYEPHIALFVPDEDPILFYRPVADFGLEKLTANGLLYLEINTMHSEMIYSILSQKGYRHIEILNDLAGKERFIKASK